MDKGPNSRREFLKTTSVAVAGASLAGQASAEEADKPPILNYNPKMTYRPLGKTGFMISEVSLGGHGGRGCPCVLLHR